MFSEKTNCNILDTFCMQHVYQGYPKPTCFVLYYYILLLLWHVTPWVPAALVMQGLVDVGSPRNPFSWHLQSKDTLWHSESLTDAFHQEYLSSNEPFLYQNSKTNYHVVPYGDHGYERVNVKKFDISTACKNYLHYDCLHIL
jgi:hypothetical protein